MSTDVADSNDQQHIQTLEAPRVSRFLRPFQLIHQQRYVPVCAATWVLLLFQIVAVIEKIRDDVFHVYSPLMLIWVIFCSLLPAVLFPAALSILFRHYPFLQRLSKAILLIAVCLIALVVNRMHFPLSFSLLAENANELLYTESLDLIYGHLLPGHIILLLLMMVTLAYQVIWGRAFVAKTAIIYPWRSLLVITMLSLASVFLPGYRAHDTLFFAHSIVDYYNDPFDHIVLEENSYPYLQEQAFVQGPTETPHIFIIAVESFNARYLSEDAPNGEPCMPFLQQLREQSFSVDQFYGNSVQTCRGHLSLLSSVLPSVRGKTFHRYEHIHLQTMASILKPYGYECRAWKAAYNKHFDNMHDFLTKHGFDEVQAMTHEHCQDLAPEHRWKWGARDRAAFQAMFRYLDQQASDAPQFVFNATITSHYPFDQMPVDQRQVYPEARTVNEHMANAMRLVDEDIQFFFDQLAQRPRFQNSLVIITGDHSWPCGEHGISINGNGYYEEFFRIPFIMHWPGRIQPQRLPGPASQIDVLPTVCDVLGIKQSHHMLGHSLFQGTEPHPVYLIQPYAGTYLMAIEHQKKYVYHMQSGAELLYDLKSDPDEQRDIFSELDEAQQQHYRNLLQQIYKNQYLLKHNRIWPAQQDSTLHARAQ